MTLIKLALFIDCGFLIGEDETIYREPTLEMYQSGEKVLSAIWGEYGSCEVITDKNCYTFLPF